MSIDLCNKVDLVREVGEGIDWGNPVASAGGTPLPPAQRSILQYAYQSVRSYADPRQVAGDPSAWASSFAYSLDRAAARLDARPSEVLRADALAHPDPVMREQALYEYADRNEPDAIELLSQAALHDEDRQVRWDALWAIEKLGGIRGVQALRAFAHDPDPEIAEWAQLFVSELETSTPAFDARSSRFTEGRTFDETIFLLIHCDLYIRLDPNNVSWAKLSLAPQGLARVYGQAHACPNVATREQQLVIAKTIAGLHPDGSPHMDNYLFRGFTERTVPRRGNFFFESHVSRPFYLSGKADDASAGVQQTQIGFTRQGTWFLDSNFPVRGAPAIRYVRGVFQGWLRQPGAPGRQAPRADPHARKRHPLDAARSGGRAAHQRLHLRHLQGQAERLGRRREDRPQLARRPFDGRRRSRQRHGRRARRAWRCLLHLAEPFLRNESFI